MLTQKGTDGLFGNRICLKASCKLRPFNPGVQYTNTDVTVGLKHYFLCQDFRVFLNFSRQMLGQQATLRHDTTRHDTTRCYHFPFELTTYNNCLNAVKRTQNEDIWHMNQAQAAQLCTYIQQIPSLKLGGDTDRSVTWFSSISTSNCRDITSVRPRSRLSKSFPIRYSPVILPSTL